MMTIVFYSFWIHFSPSLGDRFSLLGTGVSMWPKSTNQSASLRLLIGAVGRNSFLTDTEAITMQALLLPSLGMALCQLCLSKASCSTQGVKPSLIPGIRAPFLSPIYKLSSCPLDSTTSISQLLYSPPTLGLLHLTGVQTLCTLVTDWLIISLGWL